MLLPTDGTPRSPDSGPWSQAPRPEQTARWADLPRDQNPASTRSLVDGRARRQIRIYTRHWLSTYVPGPTQAVKHHDPPPQTLDDINWETYRDGCHRTLPVQTSPQSLRPHKTRVLFPARDASCPWKYSTSGFPRRAEFSSSAAILTGLRCHESRSGYH